MNKIASLRRIQNETKQLELQAKEHENMFTVSMVNDDMYHWNGVLYGPENSLYQGYKFNLDIKLPDDYPFSPLTIKFITPIQHININSTGDICLDILKKNWSPSQNIQSVMLSLILLLHKPNYSDALNSDLAKIYWENKKKYYNDVKQYCKEFATAK